MAGPVGRAKRLMRRGGRRSAPTGVLAVLAALAGLVAPAVAPTAAGGHVLGTHVSTACSGVLPSGAVVGMAATPDDGGYWISDRSGSVVA